jgi:Cyclic nucleotide-binding domain
VARVGDAQTESRPVDLALHNGAIRGVVVGFAAITLAEWVLGTTVAFGIRDALVVAGFALPVVVALGYGRFVHLDVRAVARLDVLELLQRVPFFAPLRVDALEGVAARLALERHPAGTEIVRQGDLDAHRWFLVQDGELAVEVDGFHVGQLRRGSQFGERGLLRNVPRSATVRAVTDVTLYGLEREAFLAALAGLELTEPGPVLPHHAALVDPATALAHAPLLHSLTRSALGQLTERCSVHQVDAETAVLMSGQREDTYHVLLSGRA